MHEHDENCGIDWHDVIKRGYRTVAQSFVATIGTVFVAGQTTEYINPDALEAAAVAFALSAATGLVTVAHNTIEGWFAHREKHHLTH